MPKEVFLVNGEPTISSSSQLAEGLAQGCLNTQSGPKAKLSLLTELFILGGDTIALISAYL